MKRLVLLVAAVVLLAPQAFAGTWLTSLAAAQKKAKTEKQIIFVDLFADWCGWCHQLEQQVFPSEIFQKATTNHVLLRLNTEDGGEGTQLSQMFSVTSLPTSLLLTHDMQVVGMIRGFLPPTDFAKSIDDFEGQWDEFKKRVANEKKIATDYQKRLDLAREFRNRHGFAPSAERFKKLMLEQKVPDTIRDQAYFELAITQAMDKKIDEALKTLKQFATVQNKGDWYERSRVLTGELYAQQGNIAGAVSELKSFKSKFPNSPLIANVNLLLPQLERRLGGQVQ